MRTKLFISLIILSITIQSCNMAKHYGNMRISHHNEHIVNPSIPHQTKIDNSTEQADENKICNSNQMTADSLNRSEVNITDTLKTTRTTIAKNQPIDFKKTQNKSHTKIQFSSVSHKKLFHKTVKKHIKNPIKKMSATKWIDVDATRTIIYVLLGLGLLILILGSLFTFSEVGLILLYILLCAVLIFAAALALGLLLMGFLRMCGLDW